MVVNREEPNKASMMISIWKKPFGLKSFDNKIQPFNLKLVFFVAIVSFKCFENATSCTIKGEHSKITIIKFVPIFVYVHRTAPI